jgi:6-phosphofructokinase 1
VLAFDEIRNPATGRTRIRPVDIDSEYYDVARDYMIRLEPSDLRDPERLGKLATAAHMTPEEFEKTFAHAAELSDRGIPGAARGKEQEAEGGS